MAGYPHKLNLLFCIPLTGRHWPPEVVFAYHSMATPMNYNIMVQTVRGMEVGQAREHFANVALANDCQYMFFMDEDVATPPHAIPELIYKMEHHPEIAVAGGIYCLKRRPAEPLVFRGNGNGPFWDWKAGEFFEVSGIGMGCTLIRVDSLKDLKKPWFRTVYDITKMLDGISGLETWTEDLYFCKRVTDTRKWKIYADGSLLCKHYNMDTGEMFDLPPDSKPVQHLRIPRGSKKILDVGSGATYTSQEGEVVSADYDEKCKPSYRCDISKLPFGNGEFDVLFSPALENFTPERVHAVLDEWKRVLKPGGELRLIVGDIEEFAKRIVDGKADPKELYRQNHKNAFTRDGLKAILEDAEMKDIKIVPSDNAHIAYRCIKRSVNGKDVQPRT